MPKLTREEHITTFIAIHKDLYDYSGLPEKIKSDTKLPIRCKKHDYTFNPNYMTHKKGHGCPICGKERSDSAKFDSEETFLKKLKNKHGDTYDLSKIVKAGKKGTDHIIVGCKIHGDFNPQISNFMVGKGCKKCDVDSRRKTKEAFVRDGDKKHNFKFDYSKVIYVDSKTPVIIGCPLHGDFEQAPNSHTNGNGCPKCSGYISKSENEIAEFVKQYIDIKQSDQKILNKKAELDIYIPSRKQAIEFDGLYWHSSKYKNKAYHKWKQDLCDKKNISLIQIFEDEWVNKQEIVKSNILNFIGKTFNIIDIRDCKIQSIVDSIEANSFLEQNYINSFGLSHINMGIYFNDELISVMSLLKNSGGNYEITRFCNKLNTAIASGFYNVLKYFENKYKPKQIIYIHDRRWSGTNIFITAGFINKGNTQPKFRYTNGKYRYDNKTDIKEEQKIYDSGYTKYVKKYLII